VSRELGSALHPDLLSYAPRSHVADADKAGQAREPEHPEGVVTNSLGGLGCEALIPVVTSEIVAELSYLDSIDYHVLKAAIPDQQSF